MRSLQSNGKAKFKSMPAPKRIYRYYATFIKETIETNTLKVTPPSEFDDPFEFCPRMNDFDELKFWDRLAKNPDALRSLASGLKVSLVQAERILHDLPTRMVGMLQ